MLSTLLTLSVSKGWVGNLGTVFVAILRFQFRRRL